MNQWIEEDFGGVNLGDQRLNRRLRILVEQFFQKPDASPKAACGGWAETTAAYRFFNNKRVSSEKIFAPHRQAISQRIQAYGGDTILCIQDTTELQYSTHTSLQEVGNLGDRGRKGLWAHSQYVVNAQGLPLGVWHSKFTIPALADPQAVKVKANSAQRRQQPMETKKSFCWLEGYRLSCQLAAAHPQQTVVSLMDREGDIYEIFAERERLKKSGQPAAHWLVRCQHDRLLEQESLHLLEQVGAAPLLGCVFFELAAKPADPKEKKPARAARTVVQEVRACSVELKAPRGKESLGPIRVTVISAREIHAPEGQEPVHWILVSSLEVPQTLAQADQLIGYYLVRWEIEVFHKILKSGCTVEKLQFEHPKRLVPCLAIYMIIAWRIHFLTKLGRHCPQLPCSVVFDEAEWKSVVRILKGPEALSTEPALGEFNQLVGQLGGHLNRPADGLPGPQTMWRGLERVRQWALCWRAFGPAG